MLGQLVRAAELPISLSLGIARRGVVLAGRVAGWAVVGIVRELTPDGGDDDTAHDWPPTEPMASPAVSVTREAEPVSPSHAEVTSESEEEVTTPTEQFTAAPEPVSAGSRTTESAGEQPAGTAAADGQPAESAAAEGQPTEAAPPIGGEEGATVEHEPGLGTSVRARTPHSALNNPVTEPDLTEWPDPYDKREDPRDPGEEMVFSGDEAHTPPGAVSTSEPHPSQDPEAVQWEGPKRDKVDQ